MSNMNKPKTYEYITQSISVLRYRGGSLRSLKPLITFEEKLDSRYFAGF